MCVCVCVGGGGVCVCKAFLTMFTLTQFLHSVNFGVAGKATLCAKYYWIMLTLGVYMDKSRNEGIAKNGLQITMNFQQGFLTGKGIAVKFSVISSATSHTDVIDILVNFTKFGTLN